MLCGERRDAQCAAPLAAGNACARWRCLPPVSATDSCSRFHCSMFCQSCGLAGTCSCRQAGSGRPHIHRRAAPRTRTSLVARHHLCMINTFKRPNALAMRSSTAARALLALLLLLGCGELHAQQPRRNATRGVRRDAAVRATAPARRAQPRSSSEASAPPAAAAAPAPVAGPRPAAPRPAPAARRQNRTRAATPPPRRPASPAPAKPKPQPKPKPVDRECNGVNDARMH